MTNPIRPHLSTIIVGLLLCGSLWAGPMTYQGQLQQGGQPFAGTANLEFRLYDQASDGSQVGPAIEFDNWPISDGLFQVELDFGDVFDGTPQWLEVRADETTLSPRQQITPAPVARFAEYRKYKRPIS